MPKMRMSFKITFSMLALALVAVIIFLLSLFSLRRVNDIVERVAKVSAPKVVVSAKIESHLRAAELAQRNLLLVDALDARKDIAASLNQLKTAMQKEFDTLEPLMEPERKSQIADLGKAWSELAAVNDQISAKALLNTATQARELSLNESSAAFAACIASLDEMTGLLTKSTAFAARPTLERANLVRAKIYSLQGLEKDSVLLSDQARIDAIHKRATDLAKEIDPEAAFLAKGEKLPTAIREKAAQFGGLYTKARDICLRTLDLSSQNEDAKAFLLAESLGKQKGDAVSSLLAAISGNAVEDFATQTVRSEEVYKSSMRWQFIISCAGLALSLAGAALILRGINNSLNRVIHELTESSAQVNAAASAIAESSHHLAEGARHQEDQLRDTASTLEEMASTTRKNADTAAQTNATTTATVKLVESGAVAVADMSKAMGEINEQSERINDIIKTIEAIAFQTNLLALNAAVEAARAGEAGKGFAVVADEVRNLAQRSAQAARDTSELIQGTVGKVRNGSEIAARLAGSFKEIESGANSFKRLIDEITSATHEQAHGVEQVNANVAQLDRSTQTNAQHARESTDVSENLTTQAGNLSEIVDSLNRLVKGSADTGRPALPAPVAARSRNRLKALPPPR